jgi:hypothetical protein
MPQCAGIKPDGGRCTVVVAPGVTHCYHHAPERAEERKCNASRGGKSKGNSEIADLKKQLKELAEGVLSGEVARSDAAVVNQILNTRARLIELERKIRETDELEVEIRRQAERMEALESVLKIRSAR